MNRTMAVLALIACSVSVAADAPRSYEDAAAIWRRNRGTNEYRDYAAEFTQFSNALRLDERGGCHSLAAGPVTLMLLVSQAESRQFAVIERVFYDTDNAKARCFERSYSGIATKIPPSFPFVLQLRME
ncbi:MAG TPA: hypothetical protein VE907_14135 [Gammaproteobacteria bacterium]|nr:hypothetical protein [Gammaproteobacteria bacterium]